MVSEARVTIKLVGAGLAACSKHGVSQSCHSIPYSLQTVGPWSTFYTHTVTCRPINKLPGQYLVKLCVQCILQCVVSDVQGPDFQKILGKT